MEACHYDESSECAHVSINEGSLLPNQEDTDGVRRPPLEGLEGGSAHPISVLELTKNEVVWWGVVTGSYLLKKQVSSFYLFAAMAMQRYYSGFEEILARRRLHSLGLKKKGCRHSRRR